MNTKPLGNYGEDVAVKYLLHKKYKIIERQFRSRHGEIDIIAQDGTNTIVFVEVKTRRNAKFGAPALAVTKYKQDKIIHTAMWYAHIKHLEQTRFRFDVVEVYIFPDGSSRVQHYINAFEL